MIANRAEQKPANHWIVLPHLPFRHPQPLPTFIYPKAKHLPGDQVPLLTSIAIPGTTPPTPPGHRFLAQFAVVPHFVVLYR